MVVTFLVRIRHFLSLLHAPAFLRSSVINHLLKIQIRNRWAAVSTWPEANYSGMDSLSLKKYIQKWPSTYAGVIKCVQWQQHKRHEFIHVPSIYTSSFHFLCSTFQCVRKPMESVDQCHCSTFILTIYSLSLNLNTTNFKSKTILHSTYRVHFIRLSEQTAIVPYDIDWFLKPRRSAFTARYELNH
jgi:hypothetical protein